MTTDDPDRWPPPGPENPAPGDAAAPTQPIGSTQPTQPIGAAQPTQPVGPAQPAPPTQPLPGPAVAYPPPGSTLPPGTPPPPGSTPPPSGVQAPPPPAGPRRGNPFGLTALILGIVALVLAAIPFTAFVAGLPALAAIVFGIVGLVVRDRRRGTSIAGLIIGVVALITAIVVSAIVIAGLVAGAVKNLPNITDLPSDFPSDFPSEFPSDILPTEGGPSGSALAPGDHTVTYRVEGAGTASIVYSTVANDSTGFARDVQVSLPRERTQHVTIASGSSGAAFFVTAVELKGSRPLSCSIAVDGASVAQRTSSVSSGFESVTCSYRPGG
ncbi:MAG: hypothetical protein QOE37_776 [Microbacteriaceae bacterium]|nr:hypothetical protein [Microbacteriaceae bacterium]